jgi:hypothetical protein
MRKLLVFTILISLFVIDGKSQNWIPINEVDTYHFAIDTVNYPSHTIWVDSVKTFADRTEYHYNRIVAPCDTCFYLEKFYKTENPEFPENRIHLLYQPQFLNNKMLCYNNGWTAFLGEDTLWINDNARVNESWMFDSSNMVLAKLISIGQGNILGTIDSIKTILLSYKDTIILSKSFGIISFPELKTHNYQYKLIGIETRKLGYTMPGVLDYYDFDIGDRFQYKGGESDPWGWEEYLKNYEITGKRLTKDSLIYDYSGFKIATRMHKVDPYWQDTFELHGQFRYSLSNMYQSIKGRWIFADSIRYFNHQDVSGYGYCHRIMRFSSDENNKLVQHAYGWVPQEGSYWDYHVNDTYSILLPISYEIEAIAFKLKIGLGMVDYNFSVFECGEGYTLTGYIKDGDTIGEIIPYNVVSVEDTKFSADIKIFPNPVFEKIYIKSSEKEIEGVYRIFSLQGREIQCGLLSRRTNEIDIQEFKSGIYILQLILADKIVTKRILKQ